MKAILDFIISLFRWWFYPSGYHEARPGILVKDEIDITIIPPEVEPKVPDTIPALPENEDDMKLSTVAIGGGILGGLALALSSTDSEKKVPVTLSTNAPAQVPGKLNPGDHVWFWNNNISITKDIPQQSWFGTTSPNDFAGHGSEIFYYVIYETEIRRGRPQMRGKEGSFSWLHNNPGNITGPQINVGQFPGKLGWHDFLVFPNFQTGFDAIAKYLRTNKRYQGKSIIQAFNIYAPKSDGGNDPDRYASEVANAAGVSVLSPIQELNDSQMKLVQEKIVQVEGSVPGNIFRHDSNELPTVIKSLLAPIAIT